MYKTNTIHLNTYKTLNVQISNLANIECDSINTKYIVLFINICTF